MALAHLLGCGASGGAVGAAAIRGLRTESDTSVLKAEAGPFAILRDASVFGAAMEVTADRAASEAARVTAVRILWGQKTGKYWLGLAQFTTIVPESDPDHPWALCGRGMYYSDATPFWYPGGAPLPADAVSQITALADRIWKDPTEPMTVRTAVTCLFLH